MNSTITVILVIAFIAFYWYSEQRMDESISEVEEAMSELVEIIEQRTELLNHRTELLNQAYVDIATLQAQMTVNKEYVEQTKFYFYYVRKEQRYGVSNVREYLEQWDWKEDAYVEGEFDCSQMSTYLEWKLENEGYHTIIVGGDSPTGSANKHAWLLVETAEGKYTPIEATALSIVNWKSPDYYNYFEYEFQFETIQEALSYSPTEFNWWE